MGAKKYSGVDKAAILMLAFGEELAGDILKELPQRDVMRITQALSKLRRVDQETVDQVVSEFGKTLETVRPSLSMPASLAKLFPVEPFPLPSLDRAEAKPLATFLSREHPQTGALILAHLDAKRAGETLRLLAPPLRAELLFRLANLEPVDPEVLQDLDEVIEREVVARGSSQAGGNLGGPEAIARMLNGMDAEAASGLLENIEEADPDLAEQVRATMFRFEDLGRLPDKDLQALLQRVENRTLKLALKGAPEKVLEVILKNLSERAGSMLMEDLQAMGPVRASEAENARQQVVHTARQMEKEGLLTLSPSGEIYV